jgi:predicted metal-dependent hydrolase
MTPPIVRNLRFTMDESVPRYWHGGRRAVSIFCDNLSIFFPAGERFFVKSVRNYQSAVTTPALEQEVRAFCGQEGVHSREHESYNEMLKRHGYPVEEMEKRVEAILNRVSTRSPEEMQLAVTCALEHFTSLLGAMLLENPRMLDGADPTMAALWRWHSAEENEHKNVAFDVYKAAKGAYPTRVAAMLGATAIFWFKVFDHQIRMMKASGILFSAEEWKSLFEFLFVKPGGMLPLFPLYLEYFRPNFHPSQIDSNKVLDDWKTDFAESPLYARTAAAGKAGPRRTAAAPAT